jgi:hypothetical protein
MRRAGGAYQWPRRFPLWLLRVAGFALIVAVSFALLPSRENIVGKAGVAESRACGPPVIVMTAQGPAREGHPPPELVHRCVADAGFRLSMSGLCVLAALLCVVWAAIVAGNTARPRDRSLR